MSAARARRLVPARRKLFVTTALPYANGPFHIGHIMEYIQADIWVRFQRMQGHEVHFVCADDTHGAPIMLKAEAEGVTPQAAGRADRGDAPEAPRRLPHQLRPLALDRLAGERRAVAGHLPAAQGAAASIYAKPVEQFYDPVKAMFLPDRYIKGECPKCGAKDQYGDACENCSSIYAPTDLIDPYSTLSGATPGAAVVRAPLLPAVRPARASRSCSEWTAAPARPRCSPRCCNKAQEWLGERRRQGARRLGHLARRALLRHPDSRTRRASTSTSGSMRRSATSRASRRTSREARTIDFARVPAGPATSSSIHFIGKDIVYFHTLFWPAMLEVRRRAVQGARQRLRPRLPHGARARRCRSRAAPASAPTSTSTSASTRSGCATTSPPS